MLYKQQQKEILYRTTALLLFIWLVCLTSSVVVIAISVLECHDILVIRVWLWAFKHLSVKYKPGYQERENSKNKSLETRKDK